MASTARDRSTKQTTTHQPIVIEDHPSPIIDADSSSDNGDQQLPNYFNLPCSPSDFKRQRRKFLLFVRVLVGYLERHDPMLCEEVRDVVRECSKRCQKREPGYESAVASAHDRLRKMICRRTWKKAHDYTEHFCRRNATLPIVSADGS